MQEEDSDAQKPKGSVWKPNVYEVYDAKGNLLNQ
jgi:hypothetical protein